MLKRHIAFYGEAPRQAAADGGFASRDNLAQAKALGVHDMAFHKKTGLRIKDMVKSNSGNCSLAQRYRIPCSQGLSERDLLLAAGNASRA